MKRALKNKDLQDLTKIYVIEVICSRCEGIHDYEIGTMESLKNELTEEGWVYDSLLKGLVCYECMLDDKVGYRTEDENLEQLPRGC